VVHRTETSTTAAIEEASSVGQEVAGR
jgi:hypothetical protein